jgi:replicative DNA helicase
VAKRQIVEAALPTNHDAERSVLGAVLLDDSILAGAQQFVRDHDFHLDSHRRIFRAMARMQEGGISIDMVTLSEELGRNRELEAVGNVSYLTSLTEGLPRRDNVDGYAKIVREKARLREIIHSLNAKLAQTMEGADHSDEIIGQIEGDMMRILDTGITHTRTMAEITHSAFSTLYLLKNSAQHLVGLRTGVQNLDLKTTGYRDGEYNVIAAWTGHGKSSLMIQGALANAQDGVPVYIVSLEMTAEQLVNRMVSVLTKIDGWKLRDPRFASREEMDQIAESMSYIKTLPITIDDPSSMSISELTARARLQIMKGAKIVFVDYLQLVGGRESDPRLRTNEVSAGLRELAKSTKRPVVVLSQLKRPAEGNTNRRPTIYDLKESGNVEQDAHAVVLLYLPKNGTAYTGEDELIIGKQRSAPTGTADVFFRGSTLTFEDRERAQVQVEVAPPPAIIKPVAVQRSFVDREGHNDD